MKKLKILMILLTLILTNEVLAQKQNLVTIEMFLYYEGSSAHPGGGGVSDFESEPFAIKIIDKNNEVSYKTFKRRKQNDRIETFPLLREEIDLWLSKGYKLFSFNVTSTGQNNSNNRYYVLLTKEE